MADALTIIEHKGYIDNIKVCKGSSIYFSTFSHKVHALLTCVSSFLE